MCKFSTVPEYKVNTQKLVCLVYKVCTKQCTIQKGIKKILFMINDIQIKETRNKLTQGGEKFVHCEWQNNSGRNVQKDLHKWKDNARLLENLILLRWQYYPMQSTDSFQSL